MCNIRRAGVEEGPMGLVVGCLHPGSKREWPVLRLGRVSTSVLGKSIGGLVPRVPDMAMDVLKVDGPGAADVPEKAACNDRQLSSSLRCGAALRDSLDNDVVRVDEDADVCRKLGLKNPAE